VNTVRWWGHPSTPGTQFRVRFYADAFGQPASTPFADEIVTPTMEASVSELVRIFTAPLSSAVSLAAGATYYFSVVEIDATNVDWYWTLANHAGSDAAHWRRTSDAAPWEAADFESNKFAFELHGLPLLTDLAVSLAATPDPVRRTQNLTYLVRVTNFGPVTAAFVILEDVLPADVTFQSISTSGTAYTPPVGSTGTIWVDLGNLPAGATSDTTIVVKVNARGGTTLTNTASVSSTVTDPIPSNNTATIETGIFGSRK
jgi:uncharacterized repeat protein (TIGR01451 family)